MTAPHPRSTSAPPDDTEDGLSYDERASAAAEAVRLVTTTLAARGD